MADPLAALAASADPPAVPAPQPPTPVPAPAPPPPSQPLPPAANITVEVPDDATPRAAERIRQLAAQHSEAQAELEQLREEAQKREDAEKSEAEREKARADRAEQKATDLEQRLQRQEREVWVRAAAGDFADPEDAVTALNLDEVTSPQEAAAQAAALLDRKPHWRRTEGTAARPAVTLPPPIDPGLGHRVHEDPDGRSAAGRDLLGILRGGKR